MEIFHSHPSFFPGRHFLLSLSSSPSRSRHPTAAAAGSRAPLHGALLPFFFLKPAGTSLYSLRAAAAMAPFPSDAPLQLVPLLPSVFPVRAQKLSSPSRAGQPTPLPFFFHGRELHLACYGRPDFSPSSLASLAQGSHGRAPLAKVLPAVASSSLRSASPTRRPCCRRAAAPCPWRPCKSSPSSPCSSPCCSAGNAATAVRSTPARAPFLAVRRGARRLFVKMRSKPRAAGSLFREALWTARRRRSPWVAVFAQPLCRRRSPPVRPRRFMFDSASGYFFPMINCVCAV